MKLLRAFSYWHELVLALLLAALLVTAGAKSPLFLGPATQIVLSTHVWELAILSLPMTLIIITAGIDLSVGATMALSAVVLGFCHKSNVAMPLACVLALLTGTAAGALNGAFIALARVHPLIVTLATLSAYRGIAEGISLGGRVTGFPGGFALLGRGTLAGLPVPAVVFLCVAALAAVVLARTPFGRSLYAMGYNETATRFSGIPTARIKLLLYTLSGLAASVVAILYVARRNTANAEIGLGLELDVITAVVLGGTSIFGGRGRIVGTILGVLLIHETREFVGWRWSSAELIQIVIGVLLIASVLLNMLLTPRGRGERE